MMWQTWNGQHVGPGHEWCQTSRDHFCPLAVFSFVCACLCVCARMCACASARAFGCVSVWVCGCGCGCAHVGVRARPMQVDSSQGLSALRCVVLHYILSRRAVFMT